MSAYPLKMERKNYRESKVLFILENVLLCSSSCVDSYKLQNKDSIIVPQKEEIEVYFCLGASPQNHTCWEALAYIAFYQLLPPWMYKPKACPEFSQHGHGACHGESSANPARNSFLKVVVHSPCYWSAHDLWTDLLWTVATREGLWFFRTVTNVMWSLP